MSPAAPILAENRGLFWCILITLDHPPRAERASCARDMLSHPVPASSLSADWREAVAFAIRNPPSFPGRSTPSAQRLRLARLPALPSIPSQPGVARPPQLSPLNLSLATPLPPVSAESLLLLPREPRRPLPPDSRPRQLIARWGLTCDHPLGTLLLGHAECHVLRWARSRQLPYSNHLGTPSPPLPADFASTLIRGLPADVSARRSSAPGCCPTLLSHPANAPIDLYLGEYYSTPRILGAFELPRTDPLTAYLESLDPQLAQRLACQGVSLRPTRLILRHHRALLHPPDSPPITVFSSCCGADFVLAAFRAEGIPYVLAGATEADPASRAAILHCHDYLDPALLYPDADTDAAITSSPDSDAFVLTSSCQPFSTNNQHITEASATRELGSLRRRASYLEHHSPRFVFIENVAGLFAPDRRAVYDSFTSYLLSLDRWHWEGGLLCPSTLGGPMTRPRIFWIGVLRAPSPTALPPEPGAPSQVIASPTTTTLSVHASLASPLMPRAICAISPFFSTAIPSCCSWYT